jgi:lysophospholipase L1-like esterase
VSILPLGDSLTWGYSASTMEPTPGGYRDPLYSLLLTEDHPVTYVGVGNGNPSATLTLAGQTANDGFSDYTSTQMDENLAGNVQPTDTTVSNLGGYWLTGGGGTGRSAQSADVILLMAGTNDIVFSDSSLTAQQIATQITSNLETLVTDVHTDDPGATILVASPPPVILFANWQAVGSPLNLDLKNLLNTPAYKSENIDYVDMYDALNQYGYYAYEDGIHLNETGYTKMAQVWNSAILADYNFADPPADPVPEPSTWALLAAGAAALFGWQRLRKS